MIFFLLLSNYQVSYFLVKVKLKIFYERIDRMSQVKKV